MQCLRTLGVLSVTLTLVWSMTLETSTTRSASPPNNTTNQNDTANGDLEANSSSLPVLDVRTPPKVQNQIKEKMSSKYSVESSHAGVAIPVDEDLDILEEESTKKMNFYKIERPTTASNGGLSTWILLSGQTSTSTKPSTKKPSVKPIIMKDEKNNETLMLSEKPMKIVKPVFKQRSTTPKSVSAKTTTTVRINTFSPSTKSTTKKTTKLTKVKASLIQQNMNNTKLDNNNNNTKTSTTTGTIKPTTTKPPKQSTTKTNISLPKIEAHSSITAVPSNSSAALPIEAKEGEQDLPSNENEQKKKSQKRKKNKNKRRKPSKASKEGNNKLKEADSPGTQLYSYLRSEILPVTVGVSLVGLLVTAGLASYYLQPFAALRRSDPVERKDTRGGYYYQDEYTNSMPEEEAIGKVIAGMPESRLQENIYNKQPSSRDAYPQNVRYRHVDRRSQIFMNPYGSVEDVKLNDGTVVNYDSQNDYNSSSDKKFVVGSIAKEAVPEVTPAVVPEHGPRNLEERSKFVVGGIPKEFYSSGGSPRNMKLRKRRQAVPDDKENEISLEDTNTSSTGVGLDTSTVAADSNTTAIETTTPHNVHNTNKQPHSFMDFLAELFKLKVRLGLELLQDVTSSVTAYVNRVRNRLDEHYRKDITNNNNSNINGTNLARS